MALANGRAVDQVVGAADFFVFVQFQSGADRARHLSKAGAHGLCQNVSHASQVPVFQTVDVVERADLHGQSEQVFGCRQQIICGQLHRCFPQDAISR